MKPRSPILPAAPKSIQKGTPLKNLLNEQAVESLANNLLLVYPSFNSHGFYEAAIKDLFSLELMQRGKYLAEVMRAFLPSRYAEAVKILVESLTPAQTEVKEIGLDGFFYLPHSFFISEYGQDPCFNEGEDPFEHSMWAIKDLTQRFTSEFAIRPFLIQQAARTLGKLTEWLDDPNPHVRRLCSEGTRSRLPWGQRIFHFIKNPQSTLVILEALKNDESLYVRRSVANHLGDIAKDHPRLVYSICTEWLEGGASENLKWVVRHALRHPAKKGEGVALEIRALAKRNPKSSKGKEGF